MSFVGDLLGFGGGGMNFRAQSADITNPFAPNGQVGQGYQRSQGGLDQQQNFLNALQAQNGIGNQSSVFGQAQGLAGLLGMQSLGMGPNPALAQLANTTAQNQAGQAALMAGQRGANANAGLIARQAAQQGAGIQQQAAGQAAVMRAQQQLAAQQMLQQQQGMMGNLANQQVAQQAGALGGYNTAAQNEQALLLNALANYNQQKVGMQSNINSSNAGVQSQTASAQGGLLGGLIGGIGSAFGMAQGGMVPGYAEGGAVKEGPQSFAGKFFKGFNDSMIQQQQPGYNPMLSAGKMIGGAIGNGMSSMFAPGPQVNPEIHQPMSGATPFSHGAMVPGQAPVSGDSIKNDKVPAMLSPKEIVIPRSITMGKDAPEKAKQFVAAVLAKNGMHKGGMVKK